MTTVNSKKYSPLSVIASLFSYIVRNAFNYTFPILLIFIEAVVRVAYTPTDLSFIGPTLASIGLGFILPLISIKRGYENKLAQKTLDELKKHKLMIVKEDSIRFYESTWFYLTLSVAFWIWSLHLSINFSKIIWFGYLPAPYIPGFLNYFMGLSLSERWKKV